MNEGQFATLLSRCQRLREGTTQFTGSMFDERENVSSDLADLSFVILKSDQISQCRIPRQEQYEQSSDSEGSAAEVDDVALTQSEPVEQKSEAAEKLDIQVSELFRSLSVPEDKIASCIDKFHSFLDDFLHELKS